MHGLWRSGPIPFLFLVSFHFEILALPTIPVGVKGVYTRKWHTDRQAYRYRLCDSGHVWDLRNGNPVICVVWS